MKPAFRRAVMIAAVFAGAIGIIALAVWLALPGWIEARLVPDLARRHGLGDVGLDIRRIGLTGLDAADIRIGKAQRLGGLALDFDPRELAGGRIRRIVLTDLNLTAVLDASGFHLPGFPVQANPPTAERTGLQVPAWQIGHMAVRGGLLTLVHRDERFKVPFSLEAIPKSGDLSRIHARLVLFDHQAPVEVLLEADLAAGTLEVQIKADDTPLEALALLTGRFSAVAPRGRLSVAARAGLSLFPAVLTAMEGEASLTDLRLCAPAFELSGPSAEAPLRLHFSGAPQTGIEATLTGSLAMARPFCLAAENLAIAGRIELNPDGLPRASLEAGTGVRLREPLPLVLAPLHLTASGDGEHIALDGTLGVSPGELPAGLKLDPPTLEATFSAGIHRLRQWQATVRTAPFSKGLGISADKSSLALTRPALRLDLNGDDTRVSLKAELGTGRGNGRMGEAKVHWQQLKAAIQGTLDLAAPLETADLHLAASLKKPGMEIEGALAEAAAIDIGGGMQHAPGLSILLDVKGGKAGFPALNAEAQNIALRLPLAWPTADGRNGTLTVGRLAFQNHDLGRMAATIGQQDRQLVVDGRLDDILFNGGPRMQFGGRAAWSDRGAAARFEAVLAPWSFPAGFDPARLHPAGAGIAVSGNIEARADLALEAGRLDSTAWMSVTNAGVALPEKSLRLSGIAARIDFADLLALRSAPGQVVRFDEAELGGILVSGGAIHFQIESARQVLLEKGALGWCGGRVYAEAMRFSPAVDDYALTLFCDRLGLADVLDQLAGLKSEGKGTINGRIPIRYRKGRLTFDSGFLYSSPGDGGTIRVTGIERLTEGMGPETLEHAQLSLASEALKDYDYTWAKVGIDSQDDQLALRLQFDGKPTRPLPFVYRQELGRFVRVEADNPGSHFQGIGLDVHLRLPLDQILRFGGLMKRME